MVKFFAPRMIVLTMLGGRRFEQKATKETKGMVGRGIRPSRQINQPQPSSSSVGGASCPAKPTGHEHEESRKSGTARTAPRRTRSSRISGDKPGPNALPQKQPGRACARPILLVNDETQARRAGRVARSFWLSFLVSRSRRLLFTSFMA